jgi:hypothetical protein
MPNPGSLVESQRHKLFPAGVPRTKSSILLTIRIHHIRWRVTGLPSTLDAFNAIPRRAFFSGGGCFLMAIPMPRLHLRYVQPRIPVYLLRAKDIKDAFKVCLTPDPSLLVESQRHKLFPAGVPRTKSSILLTIRIHHIRWRVTGLPSTLDAFNAGGRSSLQLLRLLLQLLHYYYYYYYY